MDQAQKFMQAYLKLQNNTGYASGYVTEWDIYAACSPALANCVAFSQYFVNRYTKYYNQNHFLHTVNGAQTVGNFLADAGNNGFTDGGTVPKPYAIFSVAGASFGGAGHTGVVLGVDETAGTVIIGEAGCNQPEFTGAHEYPLAQWTDGSHTYAYTDGQVLTDAIQQTVNTGE